MDCLLITVQVNLCTIYFWDNHKVAFEVGFSEAKKFIKFLEELKLIETICVAYILNVRIKALELSCDIVCGY